VKEEEQVQMWRERMKVEKAMNKLAQENNYLQDEKAILNAELSQQAATILQAE